VNSRHECTVLTFIQTRHDNSVFLQYFTFQVPKMENPMKKLIPLIVLSFALSIPVFARPRADFLPHRSCVFEPGPGVLMSVDIRATKFVRVFSEGPAPQGGYARMYIYQVKGTMSATRDGKPPSDGKSLEGNLLYTENDAFGLRSFGDEGMTLTELLGTKTIGLNNKEYSCKD
jgi:hypothetical protein